MRALVSRIDTRSEAFERNVRHNRALAEQLRAAHAAARDERSPRALERLRSQGKLLVRERLALLFDHGTPFLELMALAANRAYDGEVPQAAVVTGIGVVRGREVMVIAGDSSIKGGAWYPHTIRKMVRALEIALENRLPVVHLVDAAGAFLPLQHEMFSYGGRIFQRQCQLSAQGVAQVGLVLGHCTAGGAYVPTLCDHSIMVRGTGALFLGGPPLVKAATGEEVSVEDLGGADLHTTVSGAADYSVDSEEEGLALVREIVGQLARPARVAIDTADAAPPRYDPAELYGILPDDVKKQFDMRELLARVVDDSGFLEFKPGYGDTLVCGWAFLWGQKVGILANNGVLFSEAANKATQFMQLCDRDRDPLLFLHNITGFMIGREYERAGITKHGAQMLMVQANVTVPKLSLHVQASAGAGHYAMAGRSWDPRFVFSLPNARVSVMGADQAARTLTQLRVAALRKRGEEVEPEQLAELERDTLESYTRTSDAYHVTSELWDDGLIDPLDIRNTLGMAVAATTGSIAPRAPLGVLRA